MAKKILSLLLSVMILIAAVPAVSVTAFAETVDSAVDSITAALAPRGDVGLNTNYPGGTNVLVVAPFEDTDRDIWDDTSETVGDYMAGLLSGNCTKLLGSAATNEAILAEINKGTYAVILIDSHGNTGGFRTWSNGSLSGWFSASTLNSIVQAGTKPLNNALVYSTSCYFMENSSLSDAFIAAGAGFVCGDETESYAMPQMKQTFTWCLTGFYDGDVYTAEDAFDKAIATSRASFVWAGNGSWLLRENGEPTLEGGSGDCGENVAYRLYSENGKKLLYIYPTNNEEDLDYSMKNYYYDAPWKSAVITHVTIEDGVTSIGECAFFDCTNLTSVTIPDSVTSIGNDAFSGCASLTSVTIPDSVTSIEDYAFSGCASLTSVTIPDSVTSIWDAAFSGCTNLTSVTIPDSVTSIEDYAFSYCENLTSVTIPDSVTSIGDSAFYICQNLESATVNCSILGNAMFNGCSKLRNVTLNENITSIPQVCFVGAALTEFTVPKNVTEIGLGAFAGSKLESIYFESSTAVPTMIGEMTGDGRYLITFYADQFPYYFEKKYGRAPELIDLLVTSDHSGYSSYGMYSVEDWYEECGPDVSSVEEVTIDWFMEDYGWWSEDYADYTTIVNAYNNAATLSEKEEALKTLYRWKNYSGETGLDEYDEDRINQFAAWFTYGFVNEFREKYGREPQLLDMLVSLDYNWWPECDYYSVEDWYEECGPDVSSAEEVTLDWFMDWNDGYGWWSEDYADYHPLVEAYEAAQTRSAKIDAVANLFAARSLGDVYNTSFPLDTTIYYPLGSTAWEDTLTVRNGKIKHKIYNVATNAVIFEDGEDSSVEFMGVNETVTLSSGPALNSDNSKIVLGWYDGTAGANTSYTATAANIQTLDGVTYASETPLQKVLTSKYQEIGTVAKDTVNDKKITASNTYAGFELFGTQIRDLEDHNGLRFVTTLSEELYSAMKALDKNFNYGYVCAVQSVYESQSGVTDSTPITLGADGTRDLVCTRTGKNGSFDHANFEDYRIFSCVITYDGVDDANKGNNIIARPYISYTDANGVDRVYYFTYGTYGGTNVHGGCCTNYDYVHSKIPTNDDGLLRD